MQDCSKSVRSVIFRIRISYYFICTDPDPSVNKQKILEKS
jgi:hypothetical protein